MRKYLIAGLLAGCSLGSLFSCSGDVGFLDKKSVLLPMFFSPHSSGFSYSRPGRFISSDTGVVTGNDMATLWGDG